MKTIVISTKEQRQWQGIPGIEITPDGMFWATFYSGGPKEPSEYNCIYITTSENGTDWSNPDIVAEHDSVTRVFDPTLWVDPDAKLWLIYNQGSLANQDYTVWAKIYGTDRKWSEPFELDFNVPYAFRMNKPIVTNEGKEWILPVTWSKIKGGEKWLLGEPHFQGNAISLDNGKSWKLYGEVKAEPWALENMIIELRNHKYKYWMLIRGGKGRIWQSFSHDARKWTKGKKSKIKNRGTRFFIGRLQSGNILLINNCDKKNRTGMYVALSENEGKTWSHRLTIDERIRVSYPDAIQDKDGKIHIVYDRERYTIGEINYICLDENEILKS